MRKSSPDDLATAFRSFPRRRREVEARDPHAIGELVADLDRQLDAHLAAAAVLLGTGPRADDIADATADRPASAWDEETLEALRHHAASAGAILRQMTERVEAERPAED